jgi:DNA-binding CsgD family transcriptional regulator
MRPRPRIRAGELLVAAWRGRADEARSLAEGRAREAIADGLGADLAFVRYATAILELGLGRYHEALAAAREAVDEATVGVATMALPELVEAGARGGEPGAAAEAELLLEESTLASGTEWALGTLARSRALVAEDRDADELYRESIRRLRRCRAASGLARSHLLYGEWLRRERHQRDARDHLRRAHEMFVGMGAEAFAERANTELQATGERADSSRAAPLIELTPREAQIARLVSDGSSNPEIAAQMFISRRTVEYHLNKVFKKLGVSSRTQLTKVILEDPPGLFHA